MVGPIAQQIGESDDERNEEKQSRSYYSYPQYPVYPAYPPYPPCCGNKAVGENVEANLVGVQLSKMDINTKVEEKDGTTQNKQ